MIPGSKNFFPEKLREFDHNPEKFEELIIQPICLELKADFSNYDHQTIYLWNWRFLGSNQAYCTKALVGRWLWAPDSKAFLSTASNLAHENLRKIDTAIDQYFILDPKLETFLLITFEETIIILIL